MAKGETNSLVSRFGMNRYRHRVALFILGKIIDRLFDLHPIVKDNYYHPKMLGSWSIKAVLPCIAPHMNYADLEGINEGTGASDGFLEAIDPETDWVRKAELEKQLLRYCKFDTEAMVEIVRFLLQVDR